MLCVNSHHIDEHLASIDKKDASIEQLNHRIAQLTAIGGDFYPFMRENIMEALGALSDPQELILTHALSSGINEIGLMLGHWVENYWTLQAEKQAIKEINQ